MAEKKEEVIKVDDRVYFSSKKLGLEVTTGIIQIRNMTDDVYAIKLKSTSNAMFGMVLVYHFLDPRKLTQIYVIHKPGVPIPNDSTHYFAIHYSKSTKEELRKYCYTDLVERKKFWENRKPDGCKRCYVFFHNPDGAVIRNQKFEKKKKSGEKNEAKIEEKKVESKKEEVNEAVKKEEPKEEAKEEKKEEIEEKK